MFGLDDLAIAGLIASLAGAGMQAYGQQKSAKAVNNATNQQMMNQNRYASSIQQMAQDRAKDYEKETRQKQQDAITEELADSYTSQPLTATGIAQEAATTQGDTSSDYASAKAESDARVQDSIKTFGNLMARINGAKTMRQRENWANADAANQIGVQQALMRAQNNMDSYKVQQAQQKGQGWQNFGNMLGTAGSLMSIGSALGNLGSAGLTPMTDAAKEGLIDSTKELGKYGLDAATNINSKAFEPINSLSQTYTGLSQDVLGSLNQTPTASPFNYLPYRR